MTNIEKIKTFSVEELSKFFDSIGFDNTPWMNWFNDKYCNNCNSVKCVLEVNNKEIDCSYCEIYKKCRFFPDKLSDDIDAKEICAMWLREKYNGQLL